MTHAQARPMPGDLMPALQIPTIAGGMLDLSAPGWRAITVYRGAHCPLCLQHLEALQALAPAYAEAGIEMVAISADPAEKAAAFAREAGFRGPVGHDLSVAQMQRLGLRISLPLEREGISNPFAEPALFVVNPDARLHVEFRANAPFIRPDMQAVLNGINFYRGRGEAPRGGWEDRRVVAA